MFILLNSICADPCVFSNLVSYDVESVQKCFESLKPSIESNKKTIDSIMGLMNIYPFKYLANDAKFTSPFNIAPVDITAELQVVASALTTFESDYKFHDTLASKFRKLYDAHTKWRLPGGYGQFKAFTCVLPVYDKSTKAYVLKRVKPEMVGINQKILDSVCESFNDKVDVKIKSAGKDEEVTAFLQKNADALSFYERNRQARYNEYMAEGVYLRSLGVYSLYDLIPATYKLDDDTTVAVPFRLIPRSEIRSTTDMETANKRAPHQVDYPVAQFVSELRQAKPSFNINDSAKPAENIFNGKHFQLYNYSNTFVLTIQSFSADVVADWVYEFQTCMGILNTEKDGTLVVHVANNGGGYVTLGYRTLAVLVPFLEPKWGNYSLFKHPINQYLVANENDPLNIFATQQRFNLTDRVVFDDAQWFFDKSYEEEHTVTDPLGKQVVVKAVYTGKYSFDLAYDELPAEVYESLLLTPTPSWLKTPNNDKLVIVTDGTCGSTCACFALRAFEAGAALVLFMGGNPNVETPGAVSSFAGGSVLNMNYMDQFKLTGYNITPFLNSGGFALAHEQVHSWTNISETLDYAVRNAHAKIDVHFDTELNGWFGGDKIKEIAEEVKKAMAKCFNFMVHENSKCNQVDQNGIYGNKCVDGKYDDKCYLINCKIGYEMKGGVCTLVPKKVTPMHDNMAMTLTACILAPVLTVLIAIIVALYVRRDILINKAEAVAAVKI